MRLKDSRRLLIATCVALSALVHAEIPAAADATSDWLPGPGAAGDNTYAGFIDSPANGSTISFNSEIAVNGWVVDQSASGWSGIDDVQVYLGLQDQGGTLLSRARIAVPRNDVAAVFGNPDWATAGFSVSFADSGLAIGPNQLTIYAHTPDKGSWYRQVEVRVPAPPDRPFADDPLLIVREAAPSLEVTAKTSTLTLRGYVIDRNMPLGTVLGVGGSGVARMQVYLDGPRNTGTLLGMATLGQKNREATGFGERFLNSGFEVTVHPSDFGAERHELFLYALSAYWPNETLEIIPFTVHE